MINTLYQHKSVRIITYIQVLLLHIKHYHRYPTYSSLCNQAFTSLGFILHAHPLSLAFTSQHINNLAQSGRSETCLPGGAPSASRAYTSRNVMATQIRPHPKVVQNTALTPRIRREPVLYIECHICVCVCY